MQVGTVRSLFGDLVFLPTLVHTTDAMVFAMVVIGAPPETVSTHSITSL